MRKLGRLLVVALIVSVTASAQSYFATVLKSTGSVYVKPSGETEFNVTAEMGMGLHIGDAIMTGDDGFVAVIFQR